MPRNESRTAGKRPMRAMTPQEKMDAIGRVHTGESKAAVARDIGVPESTLRGWCKAEEKIRTQLNNVRATGTYEHILTSSSDNSDNSRPGSSSRSTPTQNTLGMSGSAEKVEEPEPGPAPKRIKLENNLTSAAAAISMNNMSTSARASTIGSDTLFNPYLYNLLANDPSKTLALFNSIMKGESLLPFSAYSSPAANLLADNLQLHRNNGAMANMTMANILPTSNMLVNGKRKYNVLGLTSNSMEMPARVATRRQNSQSPNAEKPSGSVVQPTNNRASPMPSTSANNGGTMFASTNTSTKSSKDCKKLNAIICQLQQQYVPSVRMYNMGELLANNVMNNNNIDHVDNETTNGRSPSALPPGFGDMLIYCTKLLEWLQTYGTPICTFQQVTQVKMILDNMTNWANSKLEFVETTKKNNGTS